MTTPTKSTDNKGDDSKRRPATTPPVRKKSTRRTMSKKSPYKSPTRAGKSFAKKHSRAKNLTPIRKSIGIRATKEDKRKALARAREWAKNSNKKAASLTPVDPTPPIVPDAEEKEDPQARFDCRVNESEAKSPRTKCETLRQRMLGLDIENKEMKKKALNSQRTMSNKDEDIFFDALEFLPTRHDVTVEDASDEEDDEMCDLRSDQRNRIPSSGQWMEPLEPAGVSYSTFSPKQNEP